MAKKIPGRRGGTLTIWEKGESGNPAGRPRKFISTLKNIGYNRCEINDSLQNLIAMNKIELEKVCEDDQCTILERIVARALCQSYDKKSLYNIETLLSRIYGKPAEAKQIEQKEDEYANLTSEQIAQRFTDIIVKSRSSSASNARIEARSAENISGTGNSEPQT